MHVQFKNTHLHNALYANHVYQRGSLYTLNHFLAFPMNNSDNCHICNKKHLFLNMTEYNGPISTVILDDGTTIAPISGNCTIGFKCRNNRLVRLQNISHIPTLDTLILGLKQSHQKSIGFHSVE